MELFIFLSSPVLATLSSLSIIYSIRFLDAIEREPLKPIIASFFFGIASAIAILIFPFSIGNYLINSLDLDPNLSDVFGTIIDAPLKEEIYKFIGLFFVFKAFKKEFHSLTDFVIYSCLVAAGFQFIENIIYLWGTFGYENDMTYFWNMELTGRVIENGYMHILFTAWSGFGLWFYKKSTNKKLSFIFFVLLAIGLHFFNNLSSVFSSLESSNSYSAINYLGNFSYAITRAFSIAIFISLIGFSVIKDINYLNFFIFEIYDQNSLDKPQLNTLKELSNPINHLLARYKWSWRLFNLHKSSPLRRDVFNTFSKYALTYSDEYSGKENDDKKIVLLNAKKLISDNS